MVFSAKFITFIGMSSFLSGFFLGHFMENLEEKVKANTFKKEKETQTLSTFFDSNSGSQLSPSNNENLESQINTINQKPSKYKWIFV